MTTTENIAASRTLTCTMDGQTAEAEVHVSLPFEEHGGWVCEYGVTFKGAERHYVHRIVGEDSMQALQLAIAMLGSVLLTLEGTSDWRWNDQPFVGLPASVEDSLFGDMP